jgi:hypothetical protein
MPIAFAVKISRSSIFSIFHSNVTNPMNHHYRIASFFLALGTFFLPFMAQPLIRAGIETRPCNATQVEERAKKGEISISDKERDRKHVEFCESVRGDVALGVF